MKDEIGGEMVCMVKAKNVLLYKKIMIKKLKDLRVQKMHLQNKLFKCGKN